MLSLILIGTFVLCLATAVASVLIGHQLISTYSSVFHKHYFYYLAAFYAFAFYALWGQVVTGALLSPLGTDTAVVDIVTGFVAMLGVPFLFVSWLMLLSMGYSMFGESLKPTWLLLHVAVFLALVLGTWLAVSLLQADSAQADAALGPMQAGVIIGLELLYFAAFLLVVLRFRASAEPAKRTVLLRFSALLFAAFTARSLLAGLVLVDLRFAPVSLVAYFASNLPPLLYLKANADRVFEPVKAERPESPEIERVLERHGITKRERQVVEKIRLGKTNQQIADELFISLQTVKDHTHRIYSKIGVKSRIQLVKFMSTAR